MEGRFKDWLADALAESGETRRGLARKIAVAHPEGATEKTIESARTTLRKILKGDQNPTQPTRDAIQKALDRNDAPTVEEEESNESITRDEFRTWQRVNVKLARRTAVEC